MTITLTPDQLRTLRHMLGINTPEARIPVPNRNYYAANPGDPQMLALAELGMVERYRKADSVYAYDYYRCTEAGEANAIASHKTIRNTRAQRVYLCFLDCRDVFEDLTFKRFLTDPQFAETRRNA
jgi:hypothetical protein